MITGKQLGHIVEGIKSYVNFFS